MRDEPPAATERRLSQIVTAGALKFPEQVIPRVVQILDSEAIAPQFRELFRAAVNDFESNGHSEGEETSAALASAKSDIGFRSYSECQEMEIGSRDAIVAAKQLRQLLQRRKVERKAQALIEDRENDFEGYASDLRDALDEYAEKRIGVGTLSIHTLTEYIEDPDALKPPLVIVPRLAWQARTVLVAAREKAGKSTLASGAAAAVSRGFDFLGGSTGEDRVLYVALEDHPGDMVRRLMAFGAKPENVYILDRVYRPLADLRAAVAQVKPALTIVDTLPALVESLNLDPTSSADWTPIMMSLTRLARDTETAVLILHHTTKSGTGYRDSSAIGASVDMILLLEESKGDARARRIIPRGRWNLDAYTIRLEETPESPMSYSLGTGAISVDAQVLSYVEQNPGCNARNLREGVGGNAHQVDNARKRLLKERRIVNHGEGKAHSYYTSEHAPCLALGHSSEIDRVSVFPPRHAVRHVAGHIDEGSVSPVGPPIGGHGHGHDVIPDTTNENTKVGDGNGE